LKSFAELEKNNGRFTYEQLSEKVGIPQNRNQYLPGRIYHLAIQSQFANLTEDVVNTITGGKGYYDLNPIGICLFTENFKETTVFLNFKAVPPTVLSKLLEAYYYFSSKNGLQKLFKDGKLIDPKERVLLDQPFYFIPPSILVEMLGLESLSYAINKYDNDQIVSARLIDWDQFGMLVNPITSTRGLYPEPVNIAKVYEDFIQNSLKQI
jgi:hypothetical protein